MHYFLHSVRAKLYKTWNIGEEIELKLMRRDRHSLIPVPVCPNATGHLGRYDSTKLITVGAHDIMQHIVDKELNNLKEQLAREADEPEACFIQTAITLVTDRKQALLLLIGAKNGDCAMAKDFNVGNTEPFNLTIQDYIDDDHKDLYSPDEFLKIGNLKLTKRGIVENDNFDIEDNLELSSYDNYENKFLFGDKENEQDEKTSVELAVSPKKSIPCTSKESTSNNGPKSTYYFYQESYGSHIYLHSLNIRMLTKEYETLANCPTTLKGKVLEKETISMTEETRQKYRCLAHLPIFCTIDIVEIDLQYPVISKLTFAEFEKQLQQRERNRHKRAKEEHRIERRARVEEDRIMGRTRGLQCYTQSTSLDQFPLFSTNDGLGAVGGGDNLSLNDSLVDISTAIPPGVEDDPPLFRSSCSNIPIQSDISNNTSMSFAQVYKNFFFSSKGVFPKIWGHPAHTA